MSAPIYSIPDVQRQQPDPSMYLCVQSGYTTIWYVINSTTPYEEHLRPCLPPLPKGLLQFGCGVVGPVIYVAGGEYVDDDSLHNEVHYIDTRHPASGWKKGCPMEVPRCMPHLVTVDCKLYAFGGIFRDESSYAEVFDESKSRWNALENLSLRSFPASVSGAHGVSDKNNMMKSMILFHDKVFPSVSRYNIELDSWDTFSESSLGIGKETSALVDGILYCLDWRMPGYMYGLDIFDPENKLQQVLGFESVNNRDIKWMPLPQPDYDGSSGPPGFLVSLGESKLAVLWGARIHGPDEDTFVVSYSVLNMSKRLNRTTGRVDFVAGTLSGSYYYMSGYSLVSCLPV